MILLMVINAFLLDINTFLIETSGYQDLSTKVKHETGLHKGKCVD